MERANDPHQIAPEPLWTVNDVKAFTGMKRTWIYERVASGEIPHYRLGGAVRFKPSEVRAWVEEHRVDGALAPLVRVGASE